MRPIAAIVEMDEERDRKTCIQLDQKVVGANRDLAQWLADHPKYSGRTVAEWLGCGETRIRRLRTWAEEGFVGLPFDSVNQPDSRARARAQAPLKTNENSQSVAGQEVITADQRRAEYAADEREPVETNDAPAQPDRENILFHAVKFTQIPIENAQLLLKTMDDIVPSEKLMKAVRKIVKDWSAIETKLEERLRK